MGNDWGGVGGKGGEGLWACLRVLGWWSGWGGGWVVASLESIEKIGDHETTRVRLLSHLVLQPLGLVDQQLELLAPLQHLLNVLYLFLCGVFYYCGRVDECGGDG